MIRAGALFVSIAIAFTIALLCSFLILFAFHYRLQNRENILLKKLELNTQSAINILLADSSAATEESKTIDLYAEESDSVLIKKKIWGIYEIAVVKAFSGKYSLIKTVEYGYASKDVQSMAIYMADLSRPLSLCGKTLIRGNCFLPEAGINRGYIEGKSFQGDSLVRGTIRKSKNMLPELNKDMKKQLVQMLSGKGFGAGNFKNIIPGSDTVLQSFIDSTILIRYTGNATISGKYYNGNIVVYTDSLLTIDASSILKDVMIFARRIKINKGFTGNIQAFAADSILVEEECKLEYPSVLGLFKMDYKTKQPYIVIKKGSEVKGIVFSSQSESVSDLMQTFIRVEKGAKVYGQLYADGFAGINGEVLGTVYCNKFLLKTPSSIYENYLMDAVIDHSKLSNYYVGSGLMNTASDKKIIKWLD